MPTPIERPLADEHAPYYAPYVALVPDGDLLASLDQDTLAWQALLARVDEARGDHRYADGKWTIRELVAHVVDAEQIFAYRLLRVARGDATPLPGFDENAYVANGHFARLGLAGLGSRLQAVRAATVALLRSLDADELARRGTASGKPVSARAIAWIIAGHAMHHRRVLAERYL
ncbi:MAG: DinB family protein [Gemmatimonadales bacterium]|nr:DinB family protein [Gemmatimonadales bacterium]